MTMALLARTGLPQLSVRKMDKPRIYSKHYVAWIFSKLSLNKENRVTQF